MKVKLEISKFGGCKLKAPRISHTQDCEAEELRRARHEHVFSAIDQSNTDEKQVETHENLNFHRSCAKNDDHHMQNCKKNRIKIESGHPSERPDFFFAVSRRSNV